jgi:hypothetical protein
MIKKAFISRVGEAGKTDARIGYIDKEKNICFTPMFQDDNPRFFCNDDNIVDVMPYRTKEENEEQSQQSL